MTIACQFCAGRRRIVRAVLCNVVTIELAFEMEFVEMLLNNSVSDDYFSRLTKYPQSIGGHELNPLGLFFLKF